MSLTFKAICMKKTVPKPAWRYKLGASRNRSKLITSEQHYFLFPISTGYLFEKASMLQKLNYTIVESVRWLNAYRLHHNLDRALHSVTPYNFNDAGMIFILQSNFVNYKATLCYRLNREFHRNVPEFVVTYITVVAIQTLSFQSHR